MASPVELVKGGKTFMQESALELKKVTWPDFDQLRNATLVVLVFVIGLSLVIWLMDLAVRTLIAAIMGIFGA